MVLRSVALNRRTRGGRGCSYATRDSYRRGRNPRTLTNETEPASDLKVHRSASNSVGMHLHTVRPSLVVVANLPGEQPAQDVAASLQQQSLSPSTSKRCRQLRRRHIAAAPGPAP